MSIVLYGKSSDNTLRGLRWKDFRGSIETVPKAIELKGKLLKSFPTTDSDILVFLALKGVSDVVGGRLRDWKEENHKGERLLFKMERRKI